MATFSTRNMMHSAALASVLLLLTSTCSAWSSQRIPLHSNRHHHQPLVLSMTKDGGGGDNADASSSASSLLAVRHSRKIQLDKGKKARILSRTVPITTDWNVTVWEWEKPAAVVETFWQVENQGLTLTPSSFGGSVPQQNVLDPFGLVCWPGAVVAAQELLLNQHVIKDKRVLVVGAGVGIEAQAAAVLGAASVLATDIHPTTLKLLQYGAEQSGLSEKIETQIFDLFSEHPLPECDVMVVADVLYNERLAAQVARRCIEARERSPAVTVVVSDSQRFVHKFEGAVNGKLRGLGQDLTYWETRMLPTFTGSGVLIDGDQTYDVKARVLWMGL